MTGIYIHIPFCVQKCLYCDFYSVSDFEAVNAYFNSLKNEIKDFSEKNGKINIDTIFFGGGTPSSVSGKYIYDTVNLIKECFAVNVNAEISLEANPKTFDSEKLEMYKECGINRLSIGLQSADEISLKTLGRIHTLNEFEKSYCMAKNAGFSNINIDIMYGLPNEKKEILLNTVKAVKSFNPEHISAYALTLGETTPLYGMNFDYPDDDAVFESYMMICDELSDYRHYEISNFGKIPCRHNLIYWKREDYIGFGAAASGFFRGERYTNISDIASYIKDFSKKENKEIISAKDELFEYIMLSLRIDEGLDTELLRDKYKCDLYSDNEELFKYLIKDNYMKETEKGFALTDKGFFVSNSIISSILIKGGGEIEGSK